MPKKRPFCLTIAGFDPSGGAGVLADIKTFEQFRTQGLAVQTANTVQTDSVFQSCNWTPKETILQQLDILLSAYPVRHVKIGLIENDEVLLEVLSKIRANASQTMIIWDPVLSATAGGSWNEERFREKLPEILSHLDIITPNIPEYGKLFGESEPEANAVKYGVSIYLKGGHSKEKKGKDIFYSGDKTFPINPKNSEAAEKHGTGCVLSAALTACFANGYPTVKSLLKSKSYVESLMASNSSGLGYHHR